MVYGGLCQAITVSTLFLCERLLVGLEVESGVRKFKIGTPAYCQSGLVIGK